VSLSVPADVADAVADLVCARLEEEWRWPRGDDVADAAWALHRAIVLEWRQAHRGGDRAAADTVVWPLLVAAGRYRRHEGYDLGWEAWQPFRRSGH